MFDSCSPLDLDGDGRVSGPESYFGMTYYREMTGMARQDRESEEKRFAKTEKGRNDPMGYEKRESSQGCGDFENLWGCSGFGEGENRTGKDRDTLW